MTWFNDTFTEAGTTALTSHASDSGGTWVHWAGNSTSPNIFTTLGGVVGAGSGSAQLYRTSVIATNADCVLSGAVYYAANPPTSFGIGARLDGAGNTGYLAAYVGGAVQKWGIFRIASGLVTTQLGSYSSVIAYTAADTPDVIFTVTGTGATVTLVLNVDGVDVVNTTDTDALRIVAAGYGGVFFSVGTAATCMFWSTFTGADAGAASSFTIDSPADGQVVPLSSGATGTGSITLDGTYTGAAPDQWRLVQDGGSTSVSGFDWASFSVAPAAGTFSQTIASVPKQAGWYNVQVRNSGNAISSTSGKVAPGVLVAVDGQSNAWLWFSATAYAGDSSLTPNALLRNTGIQPAGDWLVPATATMNAAIACGNALVIACSCPVALIDGSWDGSGLTLSGNGGQWISGGAAGNAYTSSAAAVTAAGKPVATIWIQGESDAGATVSQSTYYTALGQLIALRRTDLSDSDHPYVVVTLARNTAGMSDAQRESIKLAHVQKCGDSDIYRVDRLDLPLHSDGVHHSAAGFITLGQRCAQAVLYALGLVTYYRGPIISSVTQVNTTTLDVNLTLNAAATDITPSSTTTGFRVLVAGSPVTITSADRVAANRVRIVLASPAGSMPTVQYLYGAAPTVTGVQKDNSARTLPMEYNAGVLATVTNADLAAAFARRNQSGINLFGNRR